MAASAMTPESILAEANTSKDVPWYLPSIPPHLITPALTDLLSSYSGISKENQEAHICAIRDVAWQIFPMPCIGLFSFLSLSLSTHPHYASLLGLLRSSPTSKFLDLGTCLGQDIRKLHYDGIPVCQLYGTDLFPAYEDVGFRLFKDSEKLAGRFIASNFFSDGLDDPLRKSEGTWDAVAINMFLHGFSWDDQLLACRLILRLLKPVRGSMVIGSQSGVAVAGESELKAPFLKEGFSRKMWRHDRESFARIWELAGNEEDVKLDVQVEYADIVRKKIEHEAGKESGGSRFFRAEKGDVQRKITFLIRKL